MPPPRIYGPSYTQTFAERTARELSRGKGMRAELERVTRRGPVDQDLEENRLYFINRDIRTIERRSAKNKRGLSRRGQANLERLRAERDRINEGRRRAAEALEARNKRASKRRGAAGQAGQNVAEQAAKATKTTTKGRPAKKRT